MVLGQQDNFWGEAVLAVVAPKPAIDLTENELIDYCKQRIAGYKCPKKVVILKELPHTGSGKVDRKQIKEIFGKTKV